jgi:lysophospholipase L1-like esterase
VERIASEENVPLIDVRTTFLSHENWRDCLCDDGMHPNVAGHGLLCEAVLQYV